MARRYFPSITTAVRTINTPQEREYLYDTDENRAYAGDGATVGARALAYWTEPATAFTSGDATPSVKNGHEFITTGSTAITNFDDGTANQIITIIRGDSDIVITDNANIETLLNTNLTLSATRPTATFRRNGSVWTEIAGAGVSSSSVMTPAVQAASLTAAHTALGNTIFPVAAYADLQAAVDAASAAGGGLVVVDRDINIASSVTLKSEVVVQIHPGITLTWTGGSSPMFTSASNNVLQDAGIIGYGAIIAMGASATKCLELYGPYHCSFAGFRITGTLSTSVAIDVRGDVTGGSNPIGNRNPVYCLFSDIVHSGTCGRFIRLRGEGTDGVSATYPVVLNTFHNMHCNDARIIGIDFARWCDNNYFSGFTRIGITGNNAVGVSYNSENPTVNCGVYANDFDDLAVDSFGTYTGRVGVAMDNTKQNSIHSYYQFPLAEGGAFTRTANTGDYTIWYHNEALGKTQLLTNGFEFAHTSTSGVIYDIKNYDTGTSIAQLRAVSGAATGATAIVSAQAGISYVGNTSNHPLGFLVNNVEHLRLETGGSVLLKTAGAAIAPEVNDEAVLGTASLSWSDLFLASGAVINFNNGNFTVTHSSGALAFAGGQVTFTSAVAGTAALRSLNTTDNAAVQVLRLEGDRATMAANDSIYQSFVLSDANGNQDEFGRITLIGQVLTNGAEQARLDLALMSAGALTTLYNFTASSFRPNTNDGAGLGTATVSWSDLFLASGAVINFNNGDVTVTHSADLLTVAGGNLNMASGQGYRVNGTQVVGAQGAAVSDALTGGSATAADCATQLNLILARLRAHGLIAT